MTPTSPYLQRPLRTRSEVLSMTRTGRSLDGMIAEAQAMAEGDDEFDAAAGRDFLDLPTTKARLRQIANE